MIANMEKLLYNTSKRRITKKGDFIMSWIIFILQIIMAVVGIALLIVLIYLSILSINALKTYLKKNQ